MKYYITHTIVLFEKYKVLDIYTGDFKKSWEDVRKDYQKVFPQYDIGHDRIDCGKDWFVQ